RSAGRFVLIRSHDPVCIRLEICTLSPPGKWYPTSLFITAKTDWFVHTPSLSKCWIPLGVCTITPPFERLWFIVVYTGNSLLLFIPAPRQAICSSKKNHDFFASVS